MSKKLTDISEKDKLSIWKDYLDGISLNQMHKYAVFGEGENAYTPSKRLIEAILKSEPPEVVKTDLQYIHKIRGFWIYANGDKPFVIVFMPLRILAKNFQKAVRAITKDYKQLFPGHHLSTAVMEGLELDVLFKFAHEDKYQYPAWIISEDGSITKYDNRFKA